MIQLHSYFSYELSESVRQALPQVQIFGSNLNSDDVHISFPGWQVLKNGKLDFL